MIDEQRKKNIEGILDYWKLLSFLNQPGEKKFSDSSRKNYDHYRYDKCLWKTGITDRKDLKEALLEATEKTGLKYRSEIELTFGTISRDECAAFLAEKLNETDDLDIRNISGSRIALIKMQLNPNGTYSMDHTFSISPVLWTAGKVAEKNISPEKIVSVQNYQSDVREFEKLLDVGESTNDSNEIAGTDGTPVSSNYVTLELLRKIVKKINDQYPLKNFGYTEECRISFCLYRSKERAMKDEAEYFPLGMDYFSESLEEIRTRISKKKFGSTPVEQTLIDYIDAPLRETDNQINSNRLDVVHPSSFSDFQMYMNSILDIRKAPVGKWPSRYQPALMQQVAINEASSFYENDHKNVFSVNGPPGTGKTTMLKQIVADYVVKRAELLAAYEDPDDAFCQKHFSDGMMSDGGYDKWNNCYYTLKNDSINNYGILVASFNNGAVANIADEFPRFEGIQADLKTNNNDSQETKNCLNEILELFDPEKSQETIVLNKEQPLMKDVYFSSYESKLLSYNKKSHPKCWGAISARLGAQKFINNYCQNYLASLIFGALKNYRKDSDQQKENIKQWHSSVRLFQNQLNKVKHLQNEIAFYCDQLRNLHVENNGILKKWEIRKPEIEQESKKLQETIEKTERMISSLQSEAERTHSKAKQLEEKYLIPLNEKVNEKKKIHDSAFADYQKSLQLYEKSKSECEKQRRKIFDNNDFINRKKTEMAAMQKTSESDQNSVGNQQAQIREYQNLLLSSENDVMKKSAEITALNEKLETQNLKLEQLKSLGFFERYNRHNREIRNQTKNNISVLHEELTNAEKNFDEMNQLHRLREDDLQRAAVSLTETRKEIIKLGEQIKRAKNEIAEAEQKAADLNAELNKKWKSADSAKNVLNESRKCADKAEDSMKSAISDYENCLKKLEPYFSSAKEAETELQNARDTIQNATEQIDQLNEEQKKYENQIQEYLQKQRKIADKLKSEGIIVPDTDYLKDAVSETDASVKAQTSNPWMSFSYDCEREKLFRYALMVNKYFVTCSNSVKTNLHDFFAMEEGYYPGNQQRVRFSERDLRACAGPLFQSVFLLTPVISTTFASAGKMLKYVNPHQLGLLIVDEAGQSEPQCALKALLSCRKAVIVGDPHQIEPVVTDDMKILKKSFHGKIYDVYKQPGNSVQSNADLLNPVGSWSDDGTWIGSPLLVHRRCISPMFEIANEISYGNTMKQQTSEPSDKKSETFAGNGSRWYQVSGTEEQRGHGVKTQNEKALEILEEAFIKSGKNNPSIFVISPFTTVVQSFRDYVNDYAKCNPGSAINSCKDLDKWLSTHAGTIHTFQGKEADQVIFLLGCDRKTKPGAISFVGPNIVNVAVTRAKYRLFAIGDQKVWKKNKYVSTMIRKLYLCNWSKLHDLNENDPEYKKKATELINSLPDEESFDITEEKDSDGNTDYVIHESAQDLVDEKLLMKLTDENLKTIGLTKEMVEKWNSAIRLGLRTYFTLKPIVEKADVKSEDLMAVEPGILFCLGLEAQLKESITDFLKASYPDLRLNINHKDMILSECDTDQMTIGTYAYVLRKGQKKIVMNAVEKGHPDFNGTWWSEFQKQLKQLTYYRNECCHYSRDHENNKFKWKQLHEMMELLFEHGNVSASQGLDTGIMQACDSVKEELG